MVITPFSFNFRPDVSELELKLSEHSKKLSSLQQMVQDLSSKVCSKSMVFLAPESLGLLGLLSTSTS